MERAKRRVYTKQEREDVLLSVKKEGVCAAALKHGVSAGVVSRWAKAAGVRRESGSGKPADCAEKLQRALGPMKETTEAGEPPQMQAKKVGRAPYLTAPIPPVREELVQPPKTRGSRVAKVYTPSQKAKILEDAAKDGVSEAADKHGVSRFSIYDWKRKVKRAAAGEGPSPTSGPSRTELEEQRDTEILQEYRKHPGLGPSQIRNQLRRRNVHVSTHTVRLVMESAGYRPPKVERQKHDRRYEAVRPNHLWHLDFVQRYIGKSSTFTLILIDDCSRFVVGHGVDDAERADLVVDTFSEAVRRHGRPERVMHDRGSAFFSWRGISRFTALLEEMGIEQIVAEHKEWNGKVEVFNANLHKELFDAHRFYDVAEMRRRLAAHLSFYNSGRTHHALGGLLVPADRYFGRAEEVLARIEAGAGRELDDGVQLRERCLELFKVQSRGGVPEVFLLGQKLLGPPA